MRFALALAASLVAVPAAQAAIIDFETYTAGTPITSLTFTDGTTATVTTVSNRSGGSNLAGIFDTNNPTGNDTDLAGPFMPANGGGPLSPGNILILLGPDNGQGLPDDDALGGTITFNFSRPVDLLAFDYFDTEAAQDDGLVVTTDTGENSGVLTAGDNEYGTFDTPLFKVTTLTFTLGGSGGIDNIDIAPIPVPAAVPLLLSALGMLWLLGRTRRNSSR